MLNKKSQPRDRNWIRPAESGTKTKSVQFSLRGQNKFIKPGGIRVRMAPSPTGLLHIGTARTALFNFLFARKYEDVFILRIEDTDLERSDPKYEKDIIENLKWLGIRWDEGIDIGGEYAPYRQSERIPVYSKYIKKLLDEKKAFYCFHSEEELEKERETQIKEKKSPKHVCGHYDLSEKEKNNLMAKGDYIIRFRPPEKILKFNDIIRGEVAFDASLLGDISIAKELGAPLYNFAVVIDDFEMKISHIIRGEDHIANTPKQILIQEALGFPRPEYAHLPLILGPDKSKLSKRHGAVSVGEYRENGYLPEAMVNFMTFLGWNPKTDKEIYSMEELINEFSLEKINKSGAIFNIEKLDWINGMYIRKMELDDLAEKCVMYLENAGFIKKITNHKLQITNKLQTENYKLKTNEIVDFSWIKKIIELEKERIKKLSEITEFADFFFKDKLEYDKNLLKWKDMTDEDIKKILNQLKNIIKKIKEKDFIKEKLEKIIMPKAEKTGDRGQTLWPLRVALSGKKASPGPFEIMEILGKERTIKRIKDAAEKFS